MSAVFCGQALASTESATSGQSATSQCLSALPGRLGRGKFVLDGLGWKDKNQCSYYSYTTTAWWLSTLRCNKQLEAERESTIGEEGGPVRKDQSPLKKKSQEKFEGENRLGRGPKSRPMANHSTKFFFF